MKFDLIVIGGGAAGFFGAIQAATMRNGLKVLILEKSSKLLSKVRVSGGGRCNVTNATTNPFELARHYPRGEKKLKVMFKSYATTQVVEWFESKGVELKTEDDGRMFPITDSSDTIIDCFLHEADRLNIKITLDFHVSQIEKSPNGFIVSNAANEKFGTDKVLVATGGHPNPKAYDWLRALGHTILQPIPSLFTFNDQHKIFADLMGISMPDAEVRIEGTKMSQQGPLLITHWGLSGPAVIKLSAWAAEYLHQKNYQFNAHVSWIGDVKEDDIRKLLTNCRQTKPKQRIFSNPLFGMPQRLWQRLCELSEINDTKIWGEVSQKNVNKLLEHLIRTSFQIKGKTTFKEEFVTCGGVDFQEIEATSMESKILPGLYFAGEVVNIDGETGGFNFQAAWTTAYIASKALTSR